MWEMRVQMWVRGLEILKFKLCSLLIPVQNLFHCWPSGPWVRLLVRLIS